MASRLRPQRVLISGAFSALALATVAPSLGAQSFSATASGTLDAGWGSGPFQTSQTYTGPIAPSAAVSAGTASASAQLSGTSFHVAAGSGSGGAASATTTLVLQAPAGAGVRLQVAGGPIPYPSQTYLSALYCVGVPGSSICNSSGVIDAIVPPGGLSVSVDLSVWAGGWLGGFGSDVTVTWSYPGVSVTGTPTPGCLGNATAWTQGIPEVGNSAFGITCANAHPSLGGVSVIGLGGLTTPFVYDFVDVWVDPSQPLATLYLPSDPSGNLLHPLPIPGHPSFQGVTLHAQWLLLEPPNCTPLGLSGSNAIRFTIQ